MPTHNLSEAFKNYCVIADDDCKFCDGTGVFRGENHLCKCVKYSDEEPLENAFKELLEGVVFNYISGENLL